jgi:hypothetical protein
MGNLEQIKEVISNYGKLIELAESKIKIMEEIDNKYNTAKGIERVNFYGDSDVSVSCDDSCMGCYDSLSFSFPLSYLSLRDDELKVVVEQDKAKRIEQEKQKKEQKQIKEQEDKEQRELEQYKKLKDKFENDKRA